MSFASQSTQQHFHYPAEIAYEKLIEAVIEVGMSIKQKDDDLRRVSVSAGLSLFSWGENVSIVVNRDGDDACIVAIESALKLGVNIAGAHRHQKNFDKIIYALSSKLKEWKSKQPINTAPEKTDEEYLEEARRKAGLI
ncbi:hypothetical protein [Pluralibacter gergoviae]|uniref:hypothetical protein n=1 Tax=Pluralibacter gergoviae TaxID=61647 RepID=UPI001FF202DA|nr:hypothetical protein [Pluralibacter gergoviae]MCK1065088.1 hypothetical protein [Pluralibacter gergoviae]HDS1113603.1 hypothetical protein [Pluralibacter gergoviae]